MSEFNIQPNARCPFCKNPFYVSKKIIDVISIDCIKCGSYFPPQEAWGEVNVKPQTSIPNGTRRFGDKKI